MSDYSEQIKQIRTFPSLVRFLRDELDWPVATDDFEDLTFDYAPEELGIDAANAAKIEEIKRLRPLVANQPWGIFFVKFEPKQLPVVALRRILNSVVVKKRATASAAEQQKWATDDLLFISNYGEGDERRISFAHFSKDPAKNDLPTLKVIAWDELDTPLHLEHAANLLVERLSWPSTATELDDATWRDRWRSAFELKHREVITTSKALAERLALLARRIRAEILRVLEIETEDGKITQLMKAFQESLVHDLDEDGFADMYAQTIAYGLLSARIAVPGTGTPDDLTLHMRTNPFLRELMETFLHVGGRGGVSEGMNIDFDELGVSEVVQLLDAANMEAVVLDFGDKNPLEDPVIHFYELFLKEYDAKNRIRRGVFYTPRPVVSYIVHSVNHLLQTELGLQNGLADTTTWGEMAERHDTLEIPVGVSPDQGFVQVLDPATGTGTFLVEIIDLVHETLVAKWTIDGHSDTTIVELWNEYVPKHLLTRLHGYELLMAPYAICHLKIGLKLHETGYRFESEERARIYLTNTLEPASPDQIRLDLLPALAHEAQAVNEVKQGTHFTVVLGNPPYAGISENMTATAQRLVDAYKVVDGAPLGERKLWLQDDYVKFVRQAQVALERAGVGVLGYITNHGYLDNPTFRGMRQSLMGTFWHLRLLDLHGNGLKAERAPDGSVDSNVFEIRQGVAICFGVCGPSERGVVRRADLWGSSESKLGWLSTNSVQTTQWCTIQPASPFYFFGSVATSHEEYRTWPNLPALLPTYSSGVITARDDLVLDYEPEPILSRLALLRDTSISDDSLRRQLFEGKGSPKYPPGDSRGWKLPEARRKLLEDAAWRERVAPCMYRPFDRRWVYLTEEMVDWSRPELRRHLEAGSNTLLVFPRNTGAGKPWNHAFVSYAPILGRFFPDSACITYMAPLLVIEEGVLGHDVQIAANIRSPRTSEPTIEADVRRAATQELGYIYAILYSPTYRERYLSELRADFPRIPMTEVSDLHRELTRLGSELVALHLMESPKLDEMSSQFGGPSSPRVGRVGWSENTVWLDATATKGALPVQNGGSGFEGVPEAVWNFDIGGYQVCEKWLKDRKGRTLSEDDIAHYQKIVVALAETIRLMQEIDDVIDEHGGWPGAFATSDIGHPS